MFENEAILRTALNNGTLHVPHEIGLNRRTLMLSMKSALLELDALRAVIVRIAEAKHWPEEGQAWGYLIDEALHDALADAAAPLVDIREQS